MPNAPKSINNLIDIAKINGGYKSYNKLAEGLGVSSPTMVHWRKNHAWPIDEHVEALSLMAGFDPDLTIVELRIWKNEGPAKARWIHIFERLSATAAALLFVFLLSPGTAKAAGTFAEQGNMGANTLYIMEN